MKKLIPAIFCTLFLLLSFCQICTASTPAEFKLLASDGARGDWFGRYMDIIGDRCIVGAYGDNDNGSMSGSAYVFEWNGTRWAQKFKIIATGSSGAAKFGSAVSMSGDRCIIGAYGDDDNGNHSGAAYIFEWNGTQWIQKAKLKASDGAGGDAFGLSVGISGDFCIVGAYFDDDNGSDSGSAYIFSWDGTNWFQRAKLKASDGASGDRFGLSVGISGNYCIIGADGDNDKGGDSGSVYFFEFNGTRWRPMGKVTASDGYSDDLFGFSVSISGDRCIVGASGNDDKGYSSGSAYIFECDGTSWIEKAKLIASDGNAYDYFGYSVDISGDHCIVGAYGNDDNGEQSGSAYIFKWNGLNWIEKTKLTASDGKTDDFFGFGVEVSDGRYIVGAEGVDDNGDNSGAAYVYHLEPDNQIPVANAGPNQTVYVCDEDSLADVTLDGSGSFDEDGDDLNYFWSWIIDSNLYEANGVTPTIQLPVGEHEIELVVDDGKDESEPNYRTINVVGPVKAKLFCVPQILNTKMQYGILSAMIYLPKGISPDDIDATEPLVLSPGNVESKRQFVFQRQQQTWILASFSRGDCMDNLSIGINKIKVTGRLKSGQCYYGDSYIFVFKPKPFRWPWLLR